MEAKKIGRPTESKKNHMIRVRMDKETVQKLDECVQELNSNRSSIIREGICEIHQKLGRINRKK